MGCPPSTLATQLVSTEHVRGTPYQDEISCVRRPRHTWLTTFLTQQSMMVMLKGKSSDKVPVKSGVPQGTVLNPILFLCHTNDLPSCVTYPGLALCWQLSCLQRNWQVPCPHNPPKWPKAAWIQPGPKNGEWNSVQRNATFWALKTKPSSSTASTMKS